MNEALLLVVGFLLGSIPFGLLVARAKGVDIRSVGSGNIGATNVYRELGPVPGTLVLVLDALKGALPAAVALSLITDHRDLWSLGAGMAAILGHTFSPFLKFKGGKGVATGFGALIGSAPIVAGLVLAVFIVVVAISQYISLGSIIAAWSIPVWGFVFGKPTGLIAAYVVIAILITVLHRANIGRLRAGTERRFSFKGGSSAKAEHSADPPPSSEGGPDDTR